MITRMLKTRFARRLVYLLCTLMVLGGQPLMALQEHVRFVPREETWNAVRDLEQHLETWWDGAWQADWTVLPESLGTATPAMLAAVPFAQTDESGEAGGDSQSLSDDELRDLSQTDAVGFQEDGASEDKANAERPLPSHPDLKVGASEFRPPKELIQLMAGKADLDGAPLIPGWNLLSIPEEPADPDPATVLAPIAGAYTRAYAFDNCDAADPWKVYDPADLPNSDLTVLDHTKGFWLEATSAVELPFDGTLPATTTIPICPGWNLIGYPAGQARHVTNALYSIEGKYQRVYGYDATDPDNPWEVYSVGVPEWGNDLSLMYPGRGYWVLATEATTLEIANEGPDPVVEITSPADGSAVTSISDIVGTAFSPILAEWSLSLREIGESGSLGLASGTASVQSLVLGQLDPTLLTNGLYEVELRASTYDGVESSTAIDIVIEGGLKLGNLTLPFLDFEMEILGVKLQVVRTYDSLDRGVSDFGHGWTLSFSDVTLRENDVPGFGWQGSVSPGVFPSYCILPTRPHIVTVVLPGFDVLRFQAAPEPRCQLIAPQQVVTMGFVPLAGTFATLEPVDQRTESLVVGSFPGPIELWDQYSVEPHDAETYRLTFPSGASYLIGDETGLLQASDRNGNTFDFSPEGIIHSAGTSIEFLRDAAGRVTRIVDPAGEELSYDYDSQGDLVRVTNQLGETTRFIYLENHYLHKIITPDGVETMAADYDGDGRLIQNCQNSTCLSMTHDIDSDQEVWTNPGGTSTALGYDNRGNVTSITEQGPTKSRTTTIEYNDLNQISRKVDPGGAETIASYDAKGNLLSIRRPVPQGQDPADYTTTFTYDAAGRSKTAVFPTGLSYTATYDASGNLTALVDDQNKTLLTRTYRSDGALTSETDPFGQYSYSDLNALGLPGTITDAGGGKITGSYDVSGRVSEMSVGGGPLWTFERDGLGRQVSVDYGNGTKAEYTYGGTNHWLTFESGPTGKIQRTMNPQGHLESMEVRGRVQTSYSYDAAGHLAVEQGPLDRDTRYEYDEFGYISKVIGPNGGESRFERDIMGRVIEAYDALDNNTQYTYRNDGAIASLTDARSQTWTFDSTMTQSTVTDPLNRSTTTEIDKFGNPIRISNPGGTQRSIRYLADVPIGEEGSRVEEIEYEDGRVRTFGYDALGDLVSASDLAGQAYTLSGTPDGSGSVLTAPNGETVTYRGGDSFYSYEFANLGATRFDLSIRGEISRRTSPSGATLDYRYDNLGRRVETEDSVTGDITTLGWNDADEVTTSTNSTGTTTYAYDDLGNVSSIEAPDGSRVVYRRDLLGRVTVVEQVPASTTATARVVEYRYDAGGHIVEIEDPGAGLTEFEYDAVGRLKQRRLPNGVVSEYGYDLRDQIVHISHADASGNVLLSLDYQRADGGEPTRITRESGSWVEYEYDEALRLTRESYFSSDGNLLQETSYTYDLAGNRLTRDDGSETSTYQYSSGFQLTNVSSPSENEAYTYDSNGRVASAARDGETLLFSYDGADRILSVSNSVGDLVAGYEYDGEGRRVSVSSNGQTSHQVVAPALGRGPHRMQLVTDDQGELVAGFVFAGQDVLFRYQDDAEVYYLTDGMGSVIGAADAGGSLIAELSYDAFGNLRSSVGDTNLPSGMVGDYRFQGAWLDQSTGLQYHLNRDYDPRTGRFLTRDPFGPRIEDPEGFHPYVFANGNPQLYRDDEGLFSIMSVNISMSVQGILSTIRMIALNHLRNEVREAVLEYASKLIINALVGFLPIDALGVAGEVLAKADELLDEDAPFWKRVEKGIQGTICSIFKTGGWLYFEPGISESNYKVPEGENGFSCEELDINIGHKGSHRYPDFYISQHPPDANSGLILGEIKASIKAYYHSWIRPRSPGSRYFRPEQFETFAGHTRLYVFPPLMVLVAFNDGSDFQKNALAAAMISRGVAGFIIGLK